MISLQSSAQVEALRPDSCIQDQGTKEKKGRIGRVKGRKERGEGREVNKVPCSLPSWGTLANCLRQEETRVKRVPGAATGSGPWWASWSLSILTGQDVSQVKSPCQSCHLLQEGGPFPGPETRLLSNT